MKKQLRTKNNYEKMILSTKILFFVLATLFTIITSTRLMFADEVSKNEVKTIDKKVIIKPGKYYAVKYNHKAGKLEFPEDKAELPLPEDIVNTINDAPKWLQRDLEKNFRQLLLDRINLRKRSRISFGDINNDGTNDLVIGNGYGEVHTYLGPFWSRDEKVLEHLLFQGNVDPALFDLNNDNKTDLIVHNGGKIKVFMGPEFQKQYTIDAPDIIWDGLYVYSKDKDVFFLTKGNAFKYKDKKLIEHKELAYDGYQVFYDLDNDGKLDKVQFDKDYQLIVNLSSGKKIDIGKLVVNLSKSNTLTNYKKSDEKVFSPEGLGINDVTGDGLSDIVMGNNTGEVYFLENRGTLSQPEFYIMEKDPIVKFNFECGFFSNPSFIDLNGDKNEDLVVGNQDGELKAYLAPDWKESPKHNIKIEVGKSVRPFFADINNDGVKDLILGNQEGQVLFFNGSDWKPIPDIKMELKVKYAAPALIDLDKDGDLDLLVGVHTGQLFAYENKGNKNQPKFDKSNKDVFKNINKLKFNQSIIPAIGDLNNDNLQDIVIGHKNGWLNVLLAPDYKINNDIFFERSVDSFASPVIKDINGDSNPDIVIGNMQGSIIYLENISDEKKLAWVERFSWKRYNKGIDGITNSYGRYYLKQTNMLAPIDIDTARTYSDLLYNQQQKYRDEIAYVIANTSSEILRTMHRMKQSELLVDNVRMIYQMDKEVSYAKLIEKKDYTTISYIDKDGKPYEVPREVYYKWVVHPRLFIEIPLKINATWWDKPKEEYGMDEATYMSYQPNPSIFKLTPKSVFWRSFLPFDRSPANKKVLVERLKKAKTIWDAVYILNDHLASGETGGHMDFGYLSQDLQPLVIYKKKYGSCGEHSIIGAAFGRTALIPTSVVSKTGEDHQWNEFIYKNDWRHWDPCGSSPISVDSPWKVNEGFRHKAQHCSAITRWSSIGENIDATHVVAPPEGTVFTNSGKGYTDTAKVTVNVIDINGNPIDTALISVISHWTPTGRQANHGFTDLHGNAVFHLGFQRSGGYSIYAVTPFGSAGVNNYSVKEGDSYTLVLQVPGRKPLIENELTFAENDVSQNISWQVKTLSETSYPRNYLTGFSNSRQTFLTEKADYRGTRYTTIRHENLRGLKMFIFDEENYVKFKNGKSATALKKLPKNKDAFFVLSNRNSLFSTNISELQFSISSSSEKPSIQANLLNPNNNKVNSGEKIIYKINTNDNLGIKNFLVSLNGGISFEDASDSFKDGKFEFDLRQALQGPIVPGKYSIRFKVIDFGGNFALTNIIPLEVNSVRDFEKQIIKQDDPESALPVSSWMLGPFRVGNDERVLDINVLCDAPCDIDLFLYLDKNRNGILDGEQELYKKSSTPASNEHIFVSDVTPGTYWIYCHGWQVKSNYELFDIHLSFFPKYGFIKNVGPVGFIKNTKPEIKAEIKSPVGIKTDSIKLFLNKKDISSLANFKDGLLSVKYEKLLSSQIRKQNSTNMISVRAIDNGGNADEMNWSFKIDTKSPEIVSIEKDFTSTVSGLHKITVNASDESGISSVLCQIGNNSQIKMKYNRKNKNYYADLNFYDIKAGKTQVKVIAFDNAGNKTESIFKVKIKEKLFYFSKFLPGQEQEMYLKRPLLQTDINSKNEVAVDKLKIYLDGKEMQKGVLRTEHLLRLFTPYDLEDGEHIITYKGQDVKGNKDDRTIKFIVNTDFRKPVKN